MRLLLLFILFSMPVMADIDITTYSPTNDFSVLEGSTELALCQCEQRTDIVAVTNTGAYASRYQIAHTHPDVVTVSESLFELMPGETKSLFIYYNAPCTREFSDDVFIIITDIYGNEHIIQKDVTVGRCQNVETTLFVEGNTAIPCQELTYDLAIRNTGSFTETYEINFGGEDFDDFFDDPYQLLVLASGQEGIVQSTMILQCSQSGEFSIPFTVYAQQNGLEANLVHDFIIEESYDFSLDLGNAELCLQEENSVPLTITNNGDITNTYSISVDGGSAPPEVTLLADETRTIIIDVSPEDDLSLAVTVSDAYGGIQKTVSEQYKVRQCTSISVSVVGENIYQCAGDVELPVIVENTGEKDAWVWSNVEGAYAYLESDGQFLEAGESFETTLIIDPDGADINEQMLIQAGVDNLVANDTLFVRIFSEQACQQPLLQEVFIVVYEFDESVDARIKNDGLREVVYEISYSGDEWASMGEEPQFLTLGAGEEESIELAVYQTAINYTTYSGLFEIRAFSEGSTYEYTLPFTLGVYQKNIFELTYEYTLAYPCHTISVLLILLILIFLLIALFKKGTFEDRASLFVLLLLLWLVVAGVSYTIYGMPQLYDPILPGEDPLTLRVAENDQLTMNLSTYFSDPDGDTLYFSVSQIDVVDVVVDGDIATFTPLADWSGTRRFRVTATDEHGEETESPRLNLEVVNREQRSLWELYVRYCLSVNLALLFVLFLFIYYIGCKRKDKVSKKTESPKKAKKKSKKKRK